MRLEQVQTAILPKGACSHSILQYVDGSQRDVVCMECGVVFAAPALSVVV